ncbi:MAG: hypothetical protein Q8S13_02085 [Dehalococcoidia bacterium]|nr:hypothetical protein [Dehalococcoidia bacterium]
MASSPLRPGDPDLVARIKRGLYVPWGAGHDHAARGAARSSRLARLVAWLRRHPLPPLPPSCGFCGGDQPPINVPPGGFVEVVCASCGKRYRVEPTYYPPPAPTPQA